MKKVTIKFMGLFVFAVLMFQTAAVFAAQSTNAAASAEINTKQTDRLIAFDIIGCSDDADREVTKAEFVQMALQTVGYLYPWDAFGGDGFSDVSVSHKYYKAAAAAKALDIASGDENNMFYPDSIISKTQAAAMLLRAAGYKQLAEAKGGYPDGYIAVCSETGLLKNLSSGSKLYFKDAVVMINNMLDANPLVMEYSKNQLLSYYTDTSKTNIEKFFNVKKQKGTVSDIDLSSRKITIRLFDGTYKTYYAKTKESLITAGGNVTLYIENDDDSVVFYIEMKSSTQVFYDYINEVNKISFEKSYSPSDIKYVYFTNKDALYNVNSAADIYYNDKKVITDANCYVNCFARVVVSENEVIRMDIYKLREGGLIYRADKNELRFTKGTVYENSVTGFEKMTDLQIIIDGQVSDNMYNLKGDMTFDYWTDGNEKCVIVASSRCVKGIIGSSGTDTIQIDGEDYEINTQFGYYNFNVRDNSYDVGGDFTDIFNQPVEMFIDDNKTVRYIRLDTAKMSQKTFNGVVMATDDGNLNSDRTVRIYKIDGEPGAQDFKVRNNLAAGSLSFDYLKSVEKNLSGFGFLKFTVNGSGEIIKAEKVPYFGYTVSKSDNFNDDRFIDEQYLGEAAIFAIMSTDGEFTVKMMPFDESISWVKPFSGLTVVSDYDIRNNPVPDYVALTVGSEDMSYTTPSMSVVKSIVFEKDDMRRLTLVNGEVYTVPSDFIDKFSLKPGVVLEYNNKYSGKYPIRINKTRDLSGNCESWDTDVFSTDSTAGFFKADDVIVRNDNIIQFEIDGQPTDVYKFYDDVNHGEAVVYEYKDGIFKEKKGVPGAGDYAGYVRSIKRYPVMYIQNGDTVWFHITYENSRREIDYLIYKSNNAFFAPEGE